MIQTKRLTVKSCTLMPWEAMFLVLDNVKLKPTALFRWRKTPSYIDLAANILLMKGFGSELLTGLKTPMHSPFSSMSIRSYDLATPST